MDHIGTGFKLPKKKSRSAIQKIKLFFQGAQPCYVTMVVHYSPRFLKHKTFLKGSCVALHNQQCNPTHWLLDRTPHSRGESL